MIVTKQDVLPFAILRYSKCLTPFLLWGIHLVLFTFFICTSLLEYLTQWSLHSSSTSLPASWERANVQEEVKSSFSAVATKDNFRYHINIQTHFLPENHSTFTNLSIEICLGWGIFCGFFCKNLASILIWYLKWSLPVVLPLSLFPFLKWHVQVVTNYLLLLGFQAC